MTQFTIRVLGVTPTIGAFEPQSIAAEDTATKIKNPTSNSPGIWTYSVLDEKVAKVVNGTVVGVAPGTTTLSAVQSPGGKYGQSNTVQTILTVTAKVAGATPKPTVSASASATPKPTASTSTGATSISVTVSKRIMTIAAVGSTTGLKITINGVLAKIGKNTVKSGSKTVLATVGTKVIYMKTFKIK